MATKIVTKNSSTASAVPTASDLVQGELAVNVADKRLFTEDNTGTIVELGTNPSTIDINAGSIDGTAIGASSASTGAFTTLTATGLTVDTNTLYVDSTNNRVGIGTISPDTLLTVAHDTADQIKIGDTTDTNFWSLRAGTNFIVKDNDVEKMRIDSSGRVGIGTTSPSGRLHLSGDSDTTSKLTAQRTGSTTGTAVLGYNYVGSFSNNDFRFFANSSEAMRIDSSGNVKLITANDTAGTSKFLTFGTNAFNRAGIKCTNAATYDGSLEFYTGNASNFAERMRIDSSGNVGIGTTSPSKPLYVQESGTGSSRGISINTATAGGNAGIGFATGGTDRFSIDTVGSAGSEALRFYSWTSSAERLRIDSSGNVGIGTSSPVSKLDAVLGSTSRILLRERSSRAYIDSVTETNSAFDSLGINGSEILFETNGSERARIDSSGNILFGKTAASTAGQGIYIEPSSIGYGRANFVSQSTTGIPLAFYYDNGSTPVNVGRVQTSATTTSYITSSDYRLKENVVELTGATERLKQLNPSRFNFIADADTTVDGFLAHEVADVVPEAISGEKDAVDADGNPEYQGIDQSKLVPLLVATIQELEARITQLENN